MVSELSRRISAILEDDSRDEKHYALRYLRRAYLDMKNMPPLPTPKTREESVNADSANQRIGRVKMAIYQAAFLLGVDLDKESGE